MNSEINTSIQKAKEAVLAGDKALAASLAQDILRQDPQQVDALLIMAGLSEPALRMGFINKVLEQDPENRTAQEAMRWAAQAARQAAGASWTPEAAPALAASAPARGPRPRSALGVGLGLLAVALLFFIAYVTNLGPAIEALFRPGLPVAETRPAQEVLSLARATLTAIAQATNSSGSLGTAEASSPSLKPSEKSPEVTSQPLKPSALAPTPTSTPSVTPVPLLTLPPQESSPAPSEKTPEPAGEPTQAYDPTSGLPIIQITPLAYLTEPDPTRDPAEIPVISIEEVAYSEEPAYEAPVASRPLGTKWIDVDLSAQVLYAYEGDTPVASFYVSTGLPDTPTVTGQYYVYIKLPSTRMTGPGYDLPNVPYTMYFYKGYGIHGTYWHSNFGTPMSHGCVNMETSSAAWLYDWAYVGILVNVHY